MFRVCGPELKVLLRKTWERKQALVPILSLLFTLFNARVFVFLKPTPQSSIKVQPCFFPLHFIVFVPPHLAPCCSAPPPSHHLSLHTHSFISLQHFRLDRSQRLLFIFAFSSSMIVCASLYVFVCAHAEYVRLRMWRRRLC